jgi:hypothetical protein
MVFIIIIFLIAASTSEAMKSVQADGTDLYKGSKKFVAVGFNYDTMPYFDHPKAKASKVKRDFIYMRKRGINTMRIFLETTQVIKSYPVRANAKTIAAYKRLLRIAEQTNMRLIVTGNIIFRPSSERIWYDRLSENQRWQVQSKFWQIIAKAGRNSPAILTYQLTSEPIVPDSKGSHTWYTGYFEGYHYVQYLALHLNGRSQSEIVQDWCGLLNKSIRKYDHDHLISVGSLPITSGPLGPSSWAKCVDVLTVHDYKNSLATVQAFAAQNKPIIIGETYPLYSSIAAWTKFLLQTTTDGYMSHWIKAWQPPTNAFLNIVPQLKEG